MAPLVMLVVVAVLWFWLTFTPGSEDTVAAVRWVFVLFSVILGLYAVGLGASVVAALVLGVYDYQVIRRQLMEFGTSPEPGLGFVTEHDRALDRALTRLKYLSRQRGAYVLVRITAAGITLSTRTTLLAQFSPREVTGFSISAARGLSRHELVAHIALGDAEGMVPLARLRWPRSIASDAQAHLRERVLEDAEAVVRGGVVATEYPSRIRNARTPRSGS